MNKVELDSCHLNKKIGSVILPDEQMRKIGFTDYSEKIWYYSRMVKFPKDKRYRDFEISFNVSIPKSGERLTIDVLDEDFCQPYDYQMMLERNPNFEPAIIVRDFVEKQMEYLQKEGVIFGHILGEYI